MTEGADGNVPLKGKLCVRSGRCCRTNPGWFAPGEAERAAEHLGMTMERFVNEFLVVDRIDVAIGRVEAYAPAKVAEDGSFVTPPGERTTAAHRHQPGACIFYDAERRACTIYPVRPYECRHYSCILPPEKQVSRERIADLWIDHHLAARRRELGVSPAEGASEAQPPPKRRLEEI